MPRTTLKQLEQCCEHLNRLTGSPLTSHIRKPETSCFKTNTGHFFLDQAYGGVKLVRYVSEDGAEMDITYGHTTKLILLGKIQAVIVGVRLGKELIK